MKNLVLKYGLWGGGIVTIFMLLGAYIWMGDGTNPNFEMGEIAGYVSMLVALSVIFFGIKNYRENHLGGSITFGQAFKVGLLITLVASLIYMTSWMIYYSVSDSAQNFPEMYKMHQLEKLEAADTTKEEIDKKMADLEAMFELYKNPLARAGITLMEIFPVGLIITLISAFLLRSKPKTT